MGEIAPPRLRDSQLEDAAAALARAFVDDPLLVYTFPDADERKRLSQPFFMQVLRQGQLVGEVYTSPGPAQAAAVWMPLLDQGNDAEAPGANPLDELPQLVGMDAMGRFDGVMQFLDQFHHRDADGPHWYLGVIGVDPSAQGRGIGRILIEHIVLRAEATGIPCYLETAQPENVPFYQHLGFELMVDTVDPHSDLRLWTFLRRPK